jgi:hypothetical protein
MRSLARSLGKRNPVRVALVRRRQRRRLRREHAPHARDVILLFTPGRDVVSGGILSIQSIHRETGALLPAAAVLLVTVPGEPVLDRYTKLDGSAPLYDLAGVLDHFRGPRRVLAHVPEYAVTPRVVAALGELGTRWRPAELHLNVLLQNVDLAPGAEAMAALRDLGSLTVTTAHEAYTSPETARRLGAPVHLLSVYITPGLYRRVPGTGKEALLVVSPDGHPDKAAILAGVAAAHPGLVQRVVRDMPYGDYKRLLERARWAATFGEGLDGYFLESVFSGGVAFAVWNERFFTPDFRSLRTVYPSHAVMRERMAADLRALSEPGAFAAYQDEQFRVCAAHYDDARYRANLRAFYAGWLRGPGA